ncbi:MAG: HD domain-containing phosphohydrolase [Bdellovibrio sp.]
MRILDLAIVSKNSVFQDRAESIANTFEFQSKIFQNEDEFFEKAESFKEIVSVVLDCSKIEKPNEVAGTIQVIKQGAPNSYILAILSSKLSAEDARIIKGSGASLVIMETEYFSSSKTEFVLTQIIRSAYIPVKVMDLIEGSEPDFPLYYLMPLNKKCLKVSKPGYPIQMSFLERYKETGELYIHRSNLKSWTEYINGFTTNDNEGRIRICRLKFLQLSQSFLDLALMIADRSTVSSFSQGKELYEKCESFAKDLLTALEGINNPWDTISNSSVGDFGSIERAPTIATYAGLLSIQSNIGKPWENMIGALFSDLGYLELKPEVTQKIRSNNFEAMSADERKEYEQHPILSLNQCLTRKLPLSENIKNIILQSHERMDQKGFPNQLRTDKLTEESMLVRLCWDLDSRSQVRFGQERITLKTAIENLSQSVLNESDNYSLVFLMKIKKFLKTVMDSAA